MTLHPGDVLGVEIPADGSIYHADTIIRPVKVVEVRDGCFSAHIGDRSIETFSIDTMESFQGKLKAVPWTQAHQSEWNRYKAMRNLRRYLDRLTALGLTVGQISEQDVDEILQLGYHVRDVVVRLSQRRESPAPSLVPETTRIVKRR